jgi:hypothetical protein
VATFIYRYMCKRKCKKYAGGGIATALMTVVNTSQSLNCKSLKDRTTILVERSKFDRGLG